MTAFARQCAFRGAILRAFPRALLIVCCIAIHPAMIAPPAHAASSLGFNLPEVGERIIGSSTTGVALHGMDAVAYFAHGRVVPGKDIHELHHGGAVWHFANRANKEAFASNPADYMPMFGGYDPVAVSQGRLLAGTPENFAVIDGRLALFASPLSRNQLVSAPSLLAEANARWPGVETQLAR